MRFIPQIWQFDTDYPSSIPSDEELGIQALNIKTHDGVAWMSNFDSHPQAVSSAAQWGRLVEGYNNRNITVTPWCVPVGTNPTVEVALVVEVLNITGHVVIDVEREDTPKFWKGGKAGIKPYMEGIRSRKPDARITLQYDVRWPENIWLDDWLPYVDDLLSMTYWTDFQVSPGAAIAQAVDGMAVTGKPYALTIPGNANFFPRYLGDADIYIWRRGTMTEACQQLFKQQVPVVRPEVGTDGRKIDDLYREQVRQAVQLQQLVDVFTRIKEAINV